MQIPASTLLRKKMRVKQKTAASQIVPQCRPCLRPPTETEPTAANPFPACNTPASLPTPDISEREEKTQEMYNKHVRVQWLYTLQVVAPELKLVLAWLPSHSCAKSRPMCAIGTRMPHFRLLSYHFSAFGFIQVAHVSVQRHKWRVCWFSRSLNGWTFLATKSAPGPFEKACISRQSAAFFGVKLIEQGTSIGRAHVKLGDASYHLHA